MRPALRIKATIESSRAKIAKSTRRLDSAAITEKAIIPLTFIVNAHINRNAIMHRDETKYIRLIGKGIKLLINVMPKRKERTSPPSFMRHPASNKYIVTFNWGFRYIKVRRSRSSFRLRVFLSPGFSEAGIITRVKTSTAAIKFSTDAPDSFKNELHVSSLYTNSTIVLNR